MLSRRVTAIAVVLALTSAGVARSESPAVHFTLSAEKVDCWNFVEVRVDLSVAPAGNPFTEATVLGRFGPVKGSARTKVEGFCDSADGQVFCIRFMPTRPGQYSGSVRFRIGDVTADWSGKFQALAAHRRGVVGVDPRYPWHFVWKRTGEHDYLNGTTAFLLMGWDNEQVIRDCIDRLAALEVNRIRVLLLKRV